ncbi:MAG TPA: hypothetical protein VGC93_19765, partial [Thermoanaerobaculia bacterium]
MKRRCVVLLMALLGLVPIAAIAGEQANAPTATGETGLFTLLSGETIPQGRWSFSLYFNNWDRLIELEGPQEQELGDLNLDWSRLSLSLGYGITDRWELSVMVPYDNLEFDNDDIIGLSTDTLDADGMGNARVGTKFRLFGNPGEFGTSKAALGLFVELPTGDDEV